MLEALKIWRIHPRELASDLQRFYHLRIADWHRGMLSSFEVLELFGVTITEPEMRVVKAWVFESGRRMLTDFPVPVDEEPTRTIRVDFAPEDGVLALALRGGERPEWKQMLAQSANELAVLRASQVQGADSDEYGARLFLPIWREQELITEQVALQELRDHPDEPGDMSSMWRQQEV